MKSLTDRVVRALVLGCAALFLAVVGTSVVGIGGLNDVAGQGITLSLDAVSAAGATSRFVHDADVAFAAGIQMATAKDPVSRSRFASNLYDSLVPAADRSLAALRTAARIPGIGIGEPVDRISKSWTPFRSLLSPDVNTTPDAGAAPATRLAAAYATLDTDIEALLRREVDQAAATRDASATVFRRLLLNSLVAITVTAIGTALLARRGSRRIRRAMRPVESQAEFVETLQLAETEDEAHRLLKRHLERAVPRSDVTVLNRNNSADRLEAVTELTPGSTLIASLQHAQPRSCLAVRSGRSHREDIAADALLTCPVCSGCPGRSSCTPLTVAGSVIGSVLVNRPRGAAAPDYGLIKDAVGQAAPVLANLRNLAIAELRASTDSLTGLPNKRAVGDTLKRMLAQASRTFSPLSMVVLDLDHFKSINDRLGHPVGDQVLAEVGAALRSTLRAADFAGRNGGEEFAILLPDTDLASAVIAAEKVRQAISEIKIPGIDRVVTASLGIACFPEDASGAEQLERLADSALYVAKRSGRNRVEVAVRAVDPTGHPDQPVASPGDPAPEDVPIPRPNEQIAH